MIFAFFSTKMLYFSGTRPCLRSKLNDKGDFQCLGHSNWTICSPYSYFCSKKKFMLFTFILGGQFLLPQRANNGKSGILPTLKWNDTREI